jgi:hypothetical protein
MVVINNRIHSIFTSTDQVYDEKPTFRLEET